jgi:2,4-dienoyl-CoA reductase-like NADH-dependent reductase (Old Yellow Enzyme family)
MWRPPERIQHQPSHGRVPTQAEAAASRLFSPVAIGMLTLKQRTWVPAMVPWRATEDGFVTDNVIDWYVRFARGRPGAIVVEATGVRDVPSGPLMRIGHDRFLPGLKRLTDAHRAALQMTDDAEIRTALAAMKDDELKDILSDRELEDLQFGARERVTDTHLPHIAELPRVLPGLFADASLRAQQAGFDGVELHYAHAYTMASFLSRTNTRTDGYGGARENRVKLPLEVFAAVRDRVGKDYAVGCRYLAEECIDGGNEVDDAVFFGEAFARAGMDFLSTSRGGKFDDAKQPGVGAAAYPYTGPSGYECMPQYISDARGPFGRNIAPTKAVREAIRAAGLTTPVVCTGGVHNFEMAEKMLADGVCDIAGAARQALSDPDWTRKTQIGRGAEVRICEYTNYCEGLDQKHKPVTCQLWDKEALDAPDAKRTSDGKRRTVAPAWEP